MISTFPRYLVSDSSVLVAETSTAGGLSEGLDKDLCYKVLVRVVKLLEIFFEFGAKPVPSFLSSR